MAELETQMLAIAKTLGFNDLKSLNAAIKKEPNLHGKSASNPRRVPGYTAEMWKQLPSCSAACRRAQLEVMPIEEFTKRRPPTHYDQGTPDGLRPGHVMVVTGDFDSGS